MGVTHTTIQNDLATFLPPDPDIVEQNEPRVAKSLPPTDRGQATGGRDLNRNGSRDPVNAKQNVPPVNHYGSPADRDERREGWETFPRFDQTLWKLSTMFWPKAGHPRSTVICCKVQHQALISLNKVRQECCKVQHPPPATSAAKPPAPRGAHTMSTLLIIDQKSITMP